MKQNKKQAKRESKEAKQRLLMDKIRLLLMTQHRETDLKVRHLADAQLIKLIKKIK